MSNSGSLWFQDPSPALSDDWILVDKRGHHHRLPKTMLFMGREECDIVVKVNTEQLSQGQLYPTCRLKMRNFQLKKTIDIHLINIYLVYIILW